ncbi:hypothetical protein CFOL_v3_00403 [Cephalotus follicularis]|uniref:Uncharacterized protein n=1 Tax=Cephalotus follicularis TaxID=3775 RepID=A0A1Q3AMS8_CEPFO|nr:hypothetical protein CFOL_v3_00403 [Cephalotus follicularis]
MKMVRKLGKSKRDLIDIEILVIGFNGNIDHAKGVIPVTLGVGGSASVAAFFVGNGTLSYHALLGRGWIHPNGVIPLSLHQLLIMWNKGNKVEVVVVDNQPFVAHTILWKPNCIRTSLVQLGS